MICDDSVRSSKPGISLSNGVSKGVCDILVVAIDPGEVNIGVCLYDPGRKMVMNFSNFNLNDYAPSKEESKFSCYVGGKAVTTNIGQCVLRMMYSNHRVFMPFGKKMKRDSGDDTIRKCIVVIEKQWNISTNNCCVLSSIQSFYTNNIFYCCESGGDEYTKYECYILHPSKLNKHFPQTFVGTETNKTLRKNRILSDGKKLVGKMEMVNALKYHTGCEEERRKVEEGTKEVTIHALDAMFYAFAMCVIHPDIKDDPYAYRLDGNSQLVWLVNNRFKRHERLKEKVGEHATSVSNNNNNNNKNKNTKRRKKYLRNGSGPSKNVTKKRRRREKLKDHHVDAIDLITPPGSPRDVT